jgi:hypothetical protein
MGLLFNDLLERVGVDLRQTRLLRHQDERLGRRSPYRVWFDDRVAFETYQSTQLTDRRSYFTGQHWASFVGTPDGRTLFVGLYDVSLIGCCTEVQVDALGGHDLAAGKYDRYECRLRPALDEYRGRLFVDWGTGSAHRAWVQKATGRSGNKPIVELARTVSEPPFPGYAAFICALSEVESLPIGWATALSAARGVYLLTCPRTREQYVGAAYGEEGFLGRWLQYARNGHGGNIRLRSRDQTDYQASILEIASFATSEADIIEMEARWKAKLQSREMGLNAN